MDISLNPSAQGKTRTVTVDFHTEEEAIEYAHKAEGELDDFVMISIEKTKPKNITVINRRRHHRTTDGRLAYGR